MVHLSWLFMWFEAISGLRINLNKSEIIQVEETIYLQRRKDHTHLKHFVLLTHRLYDPFHLPRQVRMRLE